MDLNKETCSSQQQQRSTLHRPVAVVKKKSGPLDNIIDELNRADKPDNVSEPLFSVNINSQRPTEASDLVEKPTATGRRRGHTKEKEKKRERWLLTRKTWRYMTDAGRKLFPDNMQHGADNFAQIEKNFQKVCTSEPSFILWHRKSSFPCSTSTYRRRLDKLSRHRHSSTQQKINQDINDNVDQAIESLQNFLKIRDAYKTTALLGSKTVRPDQTNSPSSCRPCNDSKSTSISEIDFDSTAYKSELFDLLQMLYKNSTLTGIQIDKITPEILEDKAVLKKIYNLLKKRQLHRILHSSEPRSKLNRTASLTSLFNYRKKQEETFTFNNSKRDIRTSGDMLLPKNTDSRSLINRQSYTTNLQHNDSFSLKKNKTRLGKGVTKNSISPESSGINQNFRDKETVKLSTEIKRQRKPPQTLTLMPSTSRKIISKVTLEKSPNSCGTQTNFIQLSELKSLAQQYESMQEHSTPASEDDTEKQNMVPTNLNLDRRKSSINNEDVSQSVSDTIKRYLKMARKKSVHDSNANRFKSVNYDKYLRNIKPQGEINPPGMDEDNHKAVQTLDAWAMIALDIIRGIDTSRTLAIAHINWRKDLDEAIKRKLEYDRKMQQTNRQTPTPSSSNPTSPTSTKDKTGRTASTLLSSSSQFLSNFWHPSSAESSSTHSLKIDIINEDNINSNSNMQKSKSLSNVGHFVSKKIWGSRSKLQNRQTNRLDQAVNSHKWIPSGNCTWISEQGQVLQLSDTSLEKLSDIEADLLMQIALEKIKELNIGFNIDLDKNSQKRRIISKKRAFTTTFFDIGKKDEHNGSASLFGTSLECCLTRDKKRDRDADHGSKQSLASFFRSNENSNRSGKFNDNVRSCESLPTRSMECGSYASAEHASSDDYFTDYQKSSSISLKKMSRSQFDIRNVGVDLDKLYEEQQSYNYHLNVPIFLIICIDYLEKHGLQKVGLFRVSTSKKRVKQLREYFDKKGNMSIPDETCPHDVATLLKEFLRDLPEPLLCKKLYGTFLETQRIRNRRLQLEAISHLIKLLPKSHRDTLYILLKFLANVAAHCDDVHNSDGTMQINGNKMDSNNLSTVFAPNILRGDKEDGNMLDAINVFRIMIDHYEEIFKVPAEILDILFYHMLDTCPEKLQSLISSKFDQLPKTHIETLNPIDNLVQMQEPLVNTEVLSDKRRQSTPILSESHNVFSASLRISIPDELTLQPKQAVHSKDNKIYNINVTEPKVPTSISNIGGATLSAKTAEFERGTDKNRIYNGAQTSSDKPRKIYKRSAIIPSSGR